MTITDSLLEVIRKQKEMDYYFPAIIRSPASAEQIQETESELDLKFNNELLELYSFADGTNTYETGTLGAIGLIPCHMFLNLSDAIVYRKCHIGMEEAFCNMETGYTPGKMLFPFLEDGAGNCYWVDLNDTENHGRIFWTNTFGEDPDYLFNSLTVMFKVIQECYDQNVFFLDDNGYLDADYQKFGMIASLYNEDIKYWKEYSR